MKPSKINMLFKQINTCILFFLFYNFSTYAIAYQTHFQSKFFENYNWLRTLFPLVLLACALIPWHRTSYPEKETIHIIRFFGIIVLSLMLITIIFGILSLGITERYSPLQCMVIADMILCTLFALAYFHRYFPVFWNLRKNIKTKVVK